MRISGGSNALCNGNHGYRRHKTKEQPEHIFRTQQFVAGMVKNHSHTYDDGNPLPWVGVRMGAMHEDRQITRN